MSTTSSDSEDEKLKLILEATDTNFLHDSLFSSKKESTITLPRAEVRKSQRVLQADDFAGIDFVPSNGVQKIMSKKLSELVNEQIEFIPEITVALDKKHKRKSRVRLLGDCECYVNPYEEFEFEVAGPLKKPTIKQRAVDNEPELDHESKLASVAIDGDSILSGKETLNWSKKSKGKVFAYKLGKGADKTQHFIEPENEFTKLRRKNKWNESKIKNK